MKTALIISSLVSASHVGATASAFCLRRLGVETIILPTTMLGRHPGWGAPGGGPLSAEKLRDMWQAIKAQNIVIDAVMTGYMADAAQVTLAAEIIGHVREANPFAHILVDPVMGDHGRLYIPEDTAQAVKNILVPLADVITPNVWELSYLTGTQAQTRKELCKAAKPLRPDALITSVPFGEQIGAVLYTHKQKAISVAHDKFDAVPHGGGDALAATYLAHVLNAETPETAFAKSAAAIFDMMSTADAQDLGELPVIRRQDALTAARPLPIERFESE